MGTKMMNDNHQSRHLLPSLVSLTGFRCSSRHLFSSWNVVIRCRNLRFAVIVRHSLSYLAIRCRHPISSCIVVIVLVGPFCRSLSTFALVIRSHHSLSSFAYVDCPHSLMNSLAHVLAHLRTHVLKHSSVRSPIQINLGNSLLRSFAYSISLPSTYQWTHALACSLTFSLVHSRLHSLTHSITHTLTSEGNGTIQRVSQWPCTCVLKSDLQKALPCADGTKHDANNEIAAKLHETRPKSRHMFCSCRQITERRDLIQEKRGAMHGADPKKTLWTQSTTLDDLSAI